MEEEEFVELQLSRDLRAAELEAATQSGVPAVLCASLPSNTDRMIA